MINALFDRTNYQLAKKHLDYTEMRHRSIASNIANTNTPGYKRIDVEEDFSAQMKRAMKNNDISSIKKIQPKIAVDENAQNFMGSTNNVEIDKELVELNKNTMEHNFLLKYMSGSYKQLKSAIAGKI